MSVIKFITKRRIEELINRASIVYGIDNDILSKLNNSLTNSNDIDLEYGLLNDSFYKGEDSFKKFVASKGFEVTLSEVEKEEVKAKINLESVSDFVNDGKSYIKIKLNDGTVKVLENMTNYKADDLFNQIQNHFLANSDGELNVSEMFNALEKTFINVSLQESSKINPEKITDEQNKRRLFVESNFPGAVVEAGLDNNIFIIKQDGLDDVVVKIDDRDGNYNIYKIEEQTYTGVKNDEVSKENNSEIKRDEYKASEEEIKVLVDKMLFEGKSTNDIFVSLMTEREFTEKEMNDLFDLVESRRVNYNSEKTNEVGFQKRFVLPENKAV